MKSGTAPIFASIAILIVAVVFTAIFCNDSGITNFETPEAIQDYGLIALSENELIEGYRLNQYVLYDPDTLVMYSLITKNKGMAMTVLYNADGTPKLYDAHEFEERN